MILTDSAAGRAVLIAADTLFDPFAPDPVLGTASDLLGRLCGNATG